LQQISSPCPQDADEDGIPDQFDQCPNDPNKGLPGIKGCGVSETTDLEEALAAALAQIESLFDILLSGEITICHNGDKTMTISLGSLGGHLGHGDTIGSCS